jgi:hypothetical protein
MIAIEKTGVSRYFVNGYIKLFRYFCETICQAKIKIKKKYNFLNILLPPASFIRKAVLFYFYAVKIKS